MRWGIASQFTTLSDGSPVKSLSVTARKRSGLRGGLLALCVLSWVMIAVGGCTEQTRYRVLSVFFDGVPRPGEKAPSEVVERRPRRLPVAVATPEPVVKFSRNENLLPPGWLPKLLATLPHDAAGYPDMAAALDGEMIAARPGTDKDAVARDVLDTPVKLIPKGKLKLIFSHQVHTHWLGCKSCHPEPFKEKAGGDDIAMSDITSGKYCGKCHGKVAFPVKGECGRCHEGMKKKKQEVEKPKPEKLMVGEIKFVRSGNDANTKEVPPAVFPHLPHRVQFRCYVCHDQIFQMKTGAEKMSMDEIVDGKFCGDCHNARLAFSASDPANCGNCHPE